MRERPGVGRRGGAGPGGALSCAAVSGGQRWSCSKRSEGAGGTRPVEAPGAGVVPSPSLAAAGSRQEGPAGPHRPRARRQNFGVFGHRSVRPAPGLRVTDGARPL